MSPPSTAPKRAFARLRASLVPILAVVASVLPASCAATQATDGVSPSPARVQLAWAVGEAGTIIATSDGRTWEAQRAPTEDDLLDVAACDPLHAWAVGLGGTIVATTDGGLTWHKQMAPLACQLTAVTCADSAHVWAGGHDALDRPLIIASADGGASWRLQWRSDQGQGRVSALAGADERTVWAAVGSRVYSTGDGGDSWRASAPLGDCLVLELACGPAAGDCWAAGGGGPFWSDEIGRVWTTADGGETWTRKRLGPSSQVNGLDVTKSGTVWISCGYRAVLVSNDGGETWMRHGAGIAAMSPNGIAFQDPVRGWLVGATRGGAGVVYATENGGRRWRRHFDSEKELRAVATAPAAQ